MKFEETTVTLQSIQPRNPITKTAIKALETKGIATQRNFLKIILKVITNIISTPRAKYWRSLFMKLIMSEAIIAVPPRYISPLSLKLFMTFLVDSISASLSIEACELSVFISSFIFFSCKSWILGEYCSEFIRSRIW